MLRAISKIDLLYMQSQTAHNTSSHLTGNKNITIKWYKRLQPPICILKSVCHVQTKDTFYTETLCTRQ